jgi:membrane protein DedA with SNARE-associated domain
MPWRTFVFWNAAGGICWATSIGLAGYFGGKAAKHVMEDLGAYGLILVPIVLIAGYLFYRSQQRRLLRSLDPEDEAGERRAAPAEPPA